MNTTSAPSIKNFGKLIARHGLVIFAGAGVSTDKPSRVPGWFTLNEMIIDALKERVTSYLGRDPKWLDLIVKGLLSRRNTSRFPPEYQAQIMAEQCGENYFRALAAVDVSQRNSTHTAIAVLARTGYLRAVVTTNFDRLIESALQAEKIVYESFIDDEDYRRLRDKDLPTPGSTAPMPVIKIHGSVERPSTMIDTLQQRLVGRGALLSETLQVLLDSHVVLYAGFSGADLNHDANYLGLRQSADTSPGAMFVQYPGSSLEPGAASLLNAYEQKIIHLETFLGDIFPQILSELNLDTPEEPSIVDPDPLQTVKANLDRWANSLQPYEAINMLSTLFDACGEEDAAWKLLHRTWKSRLSTDSKGEHYARYQYNYAKHCMQSGEMLYEETPQNFFRSYDLIPQSSAGLTLWSLYRGNVNDYLPVLLQIKEKTLTPFEDLRLAGDFMHVFAQAAVIYRWTENLDDIIESGNDQHEAGDIPRALTLWASAARLAGLMGNTGIINELFYSCESSIAYLGDTKSWAEFHLAYAMANRKRGTASVGPDLGQAIPILKDTQRWPLWIEALIEGVYYYRNERSPEETKQLVDEVSQRIAKGYEIYYPHLGIAVAEYHLGVFQWERAARELHNVRPFAEQCNNQWLLSTIDDLLKRIEEETNGSGTQ